MVEQNFIDYTLLLPTLVSCKIFFETHKYVHYTYFYINKAFSLVSEMQSISTNCTNCNIYN